MRSLQEGVNPPGTYKGRGAPQVSGTTLSHTALLSGGISNKQRVPSPVVKSGIVFRHAGRPSLVYHD